MGDEERRVAANQAEITKEHVRGDEGDDLGDHHGREREDEERVASRKAQASESIADRGAGEHRATSDGSGTEDAVPQITQKRERGTVEDIPEVVPLGRIRPPYQGLREDLTIALERRADHPVERCHEYRRDRDEQRVLGHGCHAP